MKYLLLISIAIAIVFSCTPPVVFDTAYPTDASDLIEIPFAYQGAFICDSDSSLIIINETNIIIRKEEYFRLSLKYVEEKEGCLISGDNMYVDNREECIPIVFENDSIVRGTIIENDTLFRMEPGSVARIYKGNVVISQELEDDLWAINLLALQENGDVIYKAITDKTKIRHVQQITATKELPSNRRNEPKYKVKPTMGEFDAMMKDEKVFVTCDYLTRVNLEQNYLFIN